MKKPRRRTQWVILGGIAIGGTYMVLDFFKKQVPKACESGNCPIVNSSSTSQQYHGVNLWAFVTDNNTQATLTGLQADLNNMVQNYNFNNVRHGNGVSLRSKLTLAEIDLYVNIIINTLGSGHSFILFNQGQWRELTTDQIHENIDFWVGKFGNNLGYYELTNEPWDSQPETYYQKIIEAHAYLKTKTTVPTCIGFHMNRKQAFDRLYTLPDIIGYHWYPPASTAYQQYLNKWFTPYSVQSQINMMINNQNAGGMPPITQTTDSYQSLVKALNWLDTLGKPYILNEWGFQIANNVSPLENCQKCYCSNVLAVLAQHIRPNFLGWNYYAFREPAEWSGILRSDGSQRTVASLFLKP